MRLLYLFRGKGRKAMGLMDVIWLVMGVLIVIILAKAIIAQMRFKKNGIRITAHIQGYVDQNGKPFAQYLFGHNGQSYTASGYYADESPAPDTDREILFLPDNTEYVMTDEDIRMKLWQIGGIIAGAVVAVIEVIKILRAIAG